MTSPDIPLVPGVIADVAVKVITVDNTAMTATVRVIDNNGGFLTVAVSLPQGVIRPTQFQTALGDILEQVSPEQRTAVVRWVSADGQQWSESPTGVPGRDTIGWKRIGTFPLP